MRCLFLRGQVPTDRPASQIKFDSLEENDDMWLHLFYNITKKLNAYGETWYWGGNREKEYSENFVEKWMGSFKYNREFNPNVIFARGGFAEYDAVLNRYHDAYKIYYGAGKRFYPPTKFRNYNLILNDTPKQLAYTKSHFPDSSVQLWAKPAAENIFKPIDIKKEYDVIVVGNWNKRDLKDLNFAFKHIPSDLKTIHIGISHKSLKQYKHIQSTGWIPRKDIPLFYAKSKIAVVTCKTIDSCPRVIPEALACDCPLLVLDRVKFWQEKYITPQTGKLCSTEQFSAEITNMLQIYDQYSPYEYYKNNLSMDIAVREICNVINSK